MQLLEVFVRDTVTEEQADNIGPVLSRIVTVAKVLSRVGVAEGGLGEYDVKTAPRRSRLAPCSPAKKTAVKAAARRKRFSPAP